MRHWWLIHRTASYPKSPRAVATIHDSLNRKNILFASLSPEDIDKVRACGW